MAQIREIKKRIRSIQNTKKVTHAMELVAASKMRKSQEKTLSSRPYTNTLEQIIAQLRPKTREKAHQLLTPNPPGPHMVILLTSDRGLVGGLNLNVFRETLKITYENIKFVTVGKKGLSFTTKSGLQTIASFNSDEQPFWDLTKTLSRLAIGTFVTGEVQSVLIVYPDFVSTIKQIPTIAKLLPIELEDIQLQDADEPGYLLFEPSADKILEYILPHHIRTRIYQALLEAKASEHSARMVAMKNATDAAGDLIEDLTLTYNQARQEAITKELLDIVTAQRAFE